MSTSLAHFPSGQRQHRPSDVGHIVVFLVPAVYGLISESPSGFQSFVMSRAFLSGFWELPEWRRLSQVLCLEDQLTVLPASGLQHP